MKILSSLLFVCLLSLNTYAEDDVKGGDDFRNTAGEYQALAKKYGDKGDYELAAHYKRMAEIKLDAAAKGDKGDWDSIDWTEYEEISAKVDELHSKRHHGKK